MVRTTTLINPTTGESVEITSSRKPALKGDFAKGGRVGDRKKGGSVSFQNPYVPGQYGSESSLMPLLREGQPSVLSSSNHDNFTGRNG